MIIEDWNAAEYNFSWAVQIASRCMPFDDPTVQMSIDLEIDLNHRLERFETEYKYRELKKKGFPPKKQANYDVDTR
ncbi:MAG: hypothetical protein MZV70_47235 [Desulfobacterales bacterium]|nr:hypothetical protein [Desulfobacterales bacterium]